MKLPKLGRFVTQYLLDAGPNWRRSLTVEHRGAGKSITERNSEHDYDDRATARERQEQWRREWAKPPREAVTLTLAPHPIDPPREVWIGDQRYLPVNERSFPMWLVVTLGAVCCTIAAFLFWASNGGVR